MGEKTFRKLSEGLHEAMEIARGDTSKGRIRLSCGCYLTPEMEDDFRSGRLVARIKDEDCDADGFHRMVVYGEYCLACQAKYPPGDILTEEQAEAWLNEDAHG